MVAAAQMIIRRAAPIANHHLVIVMVAAAQMIIRRAAPIANHHLVIVMVAASRRHHHQKQDHDQIIL
jgi:hypothetical protein